MISLLWLHWVFVVLHGLSLVAASGNYTLVEVGRLLIAKASLVEHGLQGTQVSVVAARGLSSCGS